ncbi:MAG TPA: response regulator [Acidobacteria bacterium]|nr:response regulator [Acidobacteriota bacterium]
MSKKILIVDDSMTTLAMESMILQGKYQLCKARDGEEAVARALAEKPDLILLDVVMPKLDGFSACAQLRQHEQTRETPIIMVTTRGEEANLEQGYSAGCTDYVTKPINAAELLSKVRNYLADGTGS